VSSVTLKQRLSNRIDDLRAGKSKESFEDDPYVRLAFQSLDLNLNDTEDRALLLRALGWALQGSRLLRPAGFLNNLVIDAQKLVDEGLTGGRQEAVKRLKSDGRYRHKYQEYSTHTLLKYLAHATERNKNPDFDKLADLYKDRPLPKPYSRKHFGPRIRSGPPSKPASHHAPSVPTDETRDTPHAHKDRRPAQRRVRKPTSIYPRLVWFKGRVYIVYPKVRKP
jgi:hypothetical protein